MNRNLITNALVGLYVFTSLFIMAIINGLTHAKWFDSGLDIIYGVVLIYLIVAIYFASEKIKNKSINCVIKGFLIVLVSRLVQITLQEIHLKTNYALSILPWSWAFADLIMVFGFFCVCRGLWGVAND